ncbi:flagellar filament capping protein FliD [Thermogemmata fonticola]|uniref:Flagellar hook-associated protein 2 n=1 Tax=Thermogemmata fonticola TaxID=2755323 RepID=A0A7V8VEP5_9BACT|nr:flagellar filament capping protein FliD [Thermogemmata fonticola]MBA2226576.1 flagellar filament capping protein FliD [Thermogemmata fonticola]
MASITGLNTNGINFSGLATGINTDVLIEGLTRINQQRIDRLKARQADVMAKQSAIATLKGYLYDLQSKTSLLARSIGSIFDTTTATSSDPNTLTVAASSSATPGSYIVSVESIAKAHMVASSGFNDPNTQLKQGTITIQFGNGQSTTINVDSTNNTLQGVVQAINSATQDLRASIINDGSNLPYKIILTAKNTGVSSAFTITSNLTNGDGEDINFQENTLQQASDAILRLGSGEGALTIRSSNNKIETVIPGVTINLLKAEPGKPINIDISRDIKKIQDGIKDFVDTYNKVMDYINEQSKYNVENQQAGVLLGNREIQDLVSDIVTTLMTTLESSSTGINRLSKIGIALTDNNKLNLDQTKLEQALSMGNTQVIADIKKLFAITGQSTNPTIEFVQGTNKTKLSTTAYEVHVTSPATRASVTASNPLSGVITIQPPDNTLVIKLNNVALLNIIVEPGTYTPEELAALLQRLINTHPNNNNNHVNVVLNNSNQLQITSQKYGSLSHVSVEGGTVLPHLGFIGGESARGDDVEGYFVVNGTSELASGSGQILTGMNGNQHTDGLQVRATSPTSTIGNIFVTIGVSAKLNSVLDKYLNPAYGRLKDTQDNYQIQIDNINKEIDKQNLILENRKNELIKQFAAMESAVSSLKNLQSQLVALMPITLMNTTRK